MTRGPVNKCGVRGCPVVGHWAAGERCPLHADSAPPRRPTLTEPWEVDR